MHKSKRTLHTRIVSQLKVPFPRLQHFQKRQDALHVGLIFDGASDSTYTGPGFQIASRGGGLDGGCAFPPSKRPSGMDLYPSAFFCPGDKEHLSLMKKRHWPSLVMTIAGMSEGGGGDNSGRDVEEAREGGRRCTVYVYDQRVFIFILHLIFLILTLHFMLDEGHVLCSPRGPVHVPHRRVRLPQVRGGSRRQGIPYRCGRRPQVCQGAGIHQARKQMICQKEEKSE